MGVVKNVGVDTFPKQGSHAMSRVRVCFNFDATHAVLGTVVRDDAEEPWQMIIRLDDGRFVRSVECQYQPMPKVTPNGMTLADRVIQRVAELPDRDSPEDWPEAMLVTADELRTILNDEHPCVADCAACYQRGWGDALQMLASAVKKSLSVASVAVLIEALRTSFDASLPSPSQPAATEGSPDAHPHE